MTSAAWSPLPYSAPDLARVRSALPDGTWAALRFSREALDSFSLATRNAGASASAVTVSADAHNALVSQLAAIYDGLAAPRAALRVLSSEPRVAVLGLASVEPVEGLSADDERARQYDLAMLRGALVALRGPAVVPSSVPGATGWPLILAGGAVILGLGGLACFAAYRASVDAVKLVEDGKTARAAIAAATAAQARRESLDVFVRTGRMPPASPLETLPQETQNTTRTWADTGLEQVSKATTTLVIGGVAVAVVAGVAVVASSLLGGSSRRRRYIEV